MLDVKIVMLDVDNCGSWVFKRNLKVESFLRTHLPHFGLGVPRYYETCVIDLKGSLLLRNVIVTDNSVIFITNPPKSIKSSSSIKFCDIRSINLVADRKALITGGRNHSYICQHVRLLYKSEKEQKHKESPHEIKMNPTDAGHNGTDVESFRSSSSVRGGSLSRSSDRTFGNYSTDKTLTTSSPLEPIVDSSLTGFSPQPTSLDWDYIPLSIIIAYEPVVTPSPPNSRSRTHSSLTSCTSPTSLDIKYQFDNDSSGSNTSVGTTSSSSESGLNLKQQHIKHTRKNVFSKERNNSRFSDRNTSFEIVNGSRSASRYSDLQNGESLYDTENEIRLGQSRQSSSEYTKLNSGLVRSRLDSRAKILLEPEPSRVLGLNSNSNREKKGRNGSERSRRRPRSVDISQLSNLRRKVFGKMFGGDSLFSSNNSSCDERDNGEKAMRSGSSLHLVRRKDKDDAEVSLSTSPISNVIMSSQEQGGTDGNLKALNFYLYQPNSILLNELFLFWNRQHLQCTMQMEGVAVSPATRNFSSFRATEKVFSKLSRAWTQDGPTCTTLSALNFNVILPKVCTLHQAMMKYYHLKRICWKDWSMMTTLLKILVTCTQANGNEDEDEDLFIDRISATAVIFDIFRLLYEASGASWFIEDTESADSINFLNNNNYNEGHSKSHSVDKAPTNLHELTGTLVQVILENCILPHGEMLVSGQGGKIKSVICNPQKFAEGQWLYSTEAKTIKVITMAHNASVALLHEILCIVHFSSKDNERAKFMSYLQNYPMEMFVKLSMTQVINLLWSNGRQIGPTQTVLLYRHVSVLQTLVDNVSSIRRFLCNTFNEEFRYFVHEESVKKKVSDRYPLKPKLLSVYDHLRQEIIGRYNFDINYQIHCDVPSAKMTIPYQYLLAHRITSHNKAT